MRLHTQTLFSLLLSYVAFLSLHWTLYLQESLCSVVKGQLQLMFWLHAASLTWLCLSELLFSLCLKLHSKATSNQVSQETQNLDTNVHVNVLSEYLPSLTAVCESHEMWSNHLRTQILQFLSPYRHLFYLFPTSLILFLFSPFSNHLSPSFYITVLQLHLLGTFPLDLPFLLSHFLMSWLYFMSPPLLSNSAPFHHCAVKTIWHQVGHSARNVIMFIIKQTSLSGKRRPPRGSEGWFQFSMLTKDEMDIV